MNSSTDEHYMAVSKMLGHALYVRALTVYADYITEGERGKAAPLRRAVASTAANWCRCADRASAFHFSLSNHLARRSLM
jgi:hypothetical protein